MWGRTYARQKREAAGGAGSSARKEDTGAGSSARKEGMAKESGFDIILNCMHQPVQTKSLS
jgi:hypothetical protein